jgi:hypothetical protein
VVRGFGGHPKFSKSIPGSAVDVVTRPEQVRSLFAAEPPIPEESATYQLMCQMPHYDADTLHDDLYSRCRRAGPTWLRAVDEFTDYVIELIDQW